MESPVSFGLKEEPASPSWELELLDEVRGVWEGCEEGDGIEIDDVTFWGDQEISELIGKEELILGLELNDIILEDETGTDLEIKEEPYASWLDSGAAYDGAESTVSVLPTYYQPPHGVWTAPMSPSDEKAFVLNGAAAPAGAIQSTSADLLQEFEDVLSQAAGSLTPPDSPRSASSAVGNTSGNGAAQLQTLPIPSPSGQGYILLQGMAPSPLESELDEFVAETLNGGACNPSPPETSVGKKTSYSSPWESPSACSSGSSDSGYEDPLWSPAKSVDSLGAGDSRGQNKRLRVTSTEERKMRKKEQNKNAATRYRMKKKMEMEEIVGEEKELLDRNESLKSDVVEITREIKYLKGLMGDLFRAKGLLRAK